MVDRGMEQGVDSCHPIIVCSSPQHQIIFMVTVRGTASVMGGYSAGQKGAWVPETWPCWPR